MANTSGIWGSVDILQNKEKFSNAVLPSQIYFTSPGTYSWVAPVGVTFVSVVVVGGGGSGASTHDSNGGGGGSLGYKNSIPVVPGESYTVVVGAGGLAAGPSGGVGAAGGQSYFISTSTVQANGGAAGAISNSGPTLDNGGYVGDGGGGGGYGTAARGGGCGAGGYYGTGGLATFTGTTTINPTGNGGSAGITNDNVWGCGGGGVGLFGAGTGGAVNVFSASWANSAWTVNLANAQFYEEYNGGKGGSGGGNSVLVPEQTSAEVYPYKSNGGFPGGGGGSAFSNNAAKGGNGGNGAVRIIWPGDQRFFPDTLTEDL